VPYSLQDAVAILVWSLLGQIVVGLPIAWVFYAVGADPTSGSPALTLVVVSQLLVLGTSLLYLRARHRLGWRLWGPVRPALRHVGWGLLIGVGGFVGIQMSLGILLTFLGETDPPEQALLSEALAGGLTTILVLVAAVVLAPILEEVVFRGVLFQGLRRRIGLWPAATISSVVFGVVHIEVVGPEALPAVIAAAVLLSAAVVPQLPTIVRLVIGATGLAALAFGIVLGGPAAVLLPTGLGLLGFVFALIFHRTGGLLVPIVGHAVFNGIAISLAIVADSMDLPV
jgi:membrane protease YdiL (CAAX protease family)